MYSKITKHQSLINTMQFCFSEMVYCLCWFSLNINYLCSKLTQDSKHENIKLVHWWQLNCSWFGFVPNAQLCGPSTTANDQGYKASIILFRTQPMFGPVTGFPPPISFKSLVASMSHLDCEYVICEKIEAWRQHSSPSSPGQQQKTSQTTEALSKPNIVHLKPTDGMPGSPWPWHAWAADFLPWW